MPSIGTDEEAEEDDETAPAPAGGSDPRRRRGRRSPASTPSPASSASGSGRSGWADMTRAEAWQAVAAFNAEWIVPSWEEARLRREFDALELVDRRNHGSRREAIDDLGPDRARTGAPAGRRACRRVAPRAGHRLARLDRIALAAGRDRPHPRGLPSALRGCGRGATCSGSPAAPDRPHASGRWSASLVPIPAWPPAQRNGIATGCCSTRRRA